MLPMLRVSRCFALVLAISACSGTHASAPEPKRAAGEPRATHAVPLAGHPPDTARARPGHEAFGGALREIEVPGPESRSPAAQTSDCPTGVHVEERGKLAARALDEVSGLAASRRQQGVLWVHNDSGDGAHVYAVSEAGVLLTSVRLRGAEAVDYEDIALGPGPVPGASYVFVADIGDNGARRPEVQIYWFEEPVLRGERGDVDAQRLDVTYEDGPRDAETLLVDPLDGDLYIVAKGALFPFDAKVPVYRIEQAALTRRRTVARRVAVIPMGPATAGDVLADGRAIALRHYTQVRLWRRREGESLVDALRGPGCPLPLADLGAQGEALGFSIDGAGYYTLAEGRAQPIYFHRFE